MNKEEQERLLDSVLRAHDRPIGAEASDHLDIKAWPMGELSFGWKELNQDFSSNPFDYHEISQIASDFREELLDLRLVMIELP